MFKLTYINELPLFFNRLDKLNEDKERYTRKAQEEGLSDYEIIRLTDINKEIEKILEENKYEAV